LADDLGHEDGVAEISTDVSMEWREYFFGRES
jgi:hypothetical protein